jgi:SAM-dependent methyltransferase
VSEHFKPPDHTPPDTFVHKLLFYARLSTDFQVNTVYRNVRSFLPHASGTIVDVGAGESPYKHLVNENNAAYCALDIYNAQDFGYANQEALHFDGEHIPFETASVDCFVCTEVIEHVEQPQTLVLEIYRVLKTGGKGLVTVPWSARYHYIPHDYYRFTPTALRRLFAPFSSVAIEPRGTDITVIVSKVIVAYMRLFFPVKRFALFFTVPLAILIAPLIAGCVVVGHASLFLRLGSADDPLGYTIWVEK